MATPAPSASPAVEVVVPVVTEAVAEKPATPRKGRGGRKPATKKAAAEAPTPLPAAEVVVMSEVEVPAAPEEKAPKKTRKPSARSNRNK